MIVKTFADFDLKQIAASGQCFRLEEAAPGRFNLLASDRYLEILDMSARQDIPGAEPSRTYGFSCTEQEFEEFWSPYFDLSADYGAVKRLVPERDRYLRNAVSFGGGIRILRQDLWETMVTFLISQQNNIPRIRRCVRLLCENYGNTVIDLSGQTHYGFPGPDKLASVSEDELRNCSLGYRAKYIRKTARDVSDGSLCLEAFRHMDYATAREALMSCYGIGIKVADCICLFALHHIEAFPIDTHIRQVLEREYPKGFPVSDYNGCAGILQQYIFYYELFHSAI
ncbi:8-oxoguanine DNA glycosylase [Lacrimispora sp. NSJ-141]|uniref:DNA-(apurinic or apyrimidinic site) lyase n=1 Tax=Lientehia hominis TaxID=2897778 RepID=A0AAP2RK55_9FIRM|nr:DNA glycosylase [Lientehia hominis]MCD2493115.1 8-oxoguanine DNA glycosylase [Lientehia hominis]